MAACINIKVLILMVKYSFLNAKSTVACISQHGNGSEQQYNHDPFALLSCHSNVLLLIIFKRCLKKKEKYIEQIVSTIRQYVLTSRQFVSSSSLCSRSCPESW